MMIPNRIKGVSKVIGYFSYTDGGNVFCDGDACVISGTSEGMATYLSKRPPESNARDQWHYLKHKHFVIYPDLFDF